MSISRAILEAKGKELQELASFVARELSTEALDIGEDIQVKIDPSNVEKVPQAWVFMQQNPTDGTD